VQLIDQSVDEIVKSVWEEEKRKTRSTCNLSVDPGPKICLQMTSAASRVSRKHVMH
jgi:hypothetical protein